VFVAFVAHLARPGSVEADIIAPRLGLTPYEARLALATRPPCVLLTTPDRDRALDVVGALRSRGHGAHVFDEEQFVPSSRMTRIDDFRLDADGIRRESTGDLLPYGDVYAILRAVVSKVEDREHVAYFFRRSGERPWFLRERHTSYVGLGEERTNVAVANFTRLLTRVRSSAPTAVFDDRLVRRRVAERLAEGGVRTSSEGMDLLAHLLAMTIASQGGSPYR